MLTNQNKALGFVLLDKKIFIGFLYISLHKNNDLRGEFNFDLLGMIWTFFIEDLNIMLLTKY